MVFEIFSRKKSFTETGKCLNVTHSAVSQQVRNLEKNLGIKLVINKQGVVTLTETGQELADDLNLCFQQLNSPVQKVLSRSKKQTITVTMTPSFAAEWMILSMSRLHKEFPHLDFVITPSFNLTDLKADNVDLGVRYGDGSWEDISVHLWKKSPFVVAVATKILPDINTLSELDLASLPWLQELGTTEVEDWAKSSGRHTKSASKLIFLPGNMILPAMREGCGIACTAKMLIQDDIDRGAVTILYSQTGDDQNFGYYLVTPNKIVDPTIQNIINWFDDMPV